MTRGKGRGQGRARGRGRGRSQPRARAAAPAVEPQVDFKEEVQVQTVPVGPVQVPEVFIATPVLQDALVRLVGFIDSVAQTGTFSMAQSVSQAGGGAQTPATHTPEQVAPCGASYEDPQDFLDHFHEVLRNMGIVETNEVDFAAFQMTGSARKWWRDYMMTRPARSPAITWDQFSQLFLEKFIHVTQREEYHMQFKRLQQGGMTVTQYETRFMDLARHATILLPTEKEQVRRFIDGLTYTLRL
ncbi:uncharacterized protein [Nicotiana tomentosiformis]|uniref:uncharacterized protein n=1 Tax=Nicotiana tomentosiformis TaxID=4098 RepID=UPI00388CE8F9